MALPTTSAVVSVGVSEERVKVDEKKPRSGMRRVFADERSLETPKEESKLRDFWYPVMFESKFNKGQEIEFDIVLFDETWVIRQVSEGEYACESKADSSKTLPTGVKDGLVMVWTGTAKHRRRSFRPTLRRRVDTPFTLNSSLTTCPWSMAYSWRTCSTWHTRRLRHRHVCQRLGRSQHGEIRLS